MRLWLVVGRQLATEEKWCLWHCWWPFLPVIPLIKVFILYPRVLFVLISDANCCFEHVTYYKYECVCVFLIFFTRNLISWNKMWRIFPTFKLYFRRLTPLLGRRASPTRWKPAHGPIGNYKDRKFICFGRSLSRPELGHENTHFLFLSGAFERGNQFAHSQACCLSLVPAKQSLHFQDHENPYVSEERCVMGMTAVMGAGVRIALAAQTHDRRPERKQKKEKSIRPACWHFVQCREKMLRQTDVCLWKQRHSEV